MIATALIPSDSSSIEANSRFLAYLAALDRGDNQQAHEHLSRAVELLDTLPRSSTPIFMAEIAYLEGWRGNASEANRWLEQLPSASAFLPPYERLRAETAALMASGEPTLALAKVEEALQLTPAEASWTRDRLTEMRNRLQSSG